MAMARTREKDEGPEVECEHWDDLYPGRFLKSSALRGKPTVITIKRVFLQRVGKDQMRVLVIEPLPGAQQVELKLNKINGILIKHLLGTAPREYAGKQLVIKPDVVEQGTYKGDPTWRVCGSPHMTVESETVIVDVGGKWWKPFPVKLTRPGGAPKEQPAEALAPATGPVEDDASPAGSEMYADLLELVMAATEKPEVVEYGEMAKRAKKAGQLTDMEFAKLKRALLDKHTQV